MNRIEETSTVKDLSLHKMPSLRSAITGMVIGASTFGAVPTASADQSAPVPAPDTSALVQQGRMVPAGPIPVRYGAGRVDGFGLDQERCLTIYESAGIRFTDPPFAFYENSDRGIKFGERIPEQLQASISGSQLGKILQSVSFEPGVNAKGEALPWDPNSSVGLVKWTVDEQLRVSEEQRPVVAEAYRISQMLSGQQTRYNPSMWLPLELTQAPIVLWDKTKNETLGYGAPKIAEGTNRTTFHIEQSPRQFAMTLKAADNHSLCQLPMFGARGHIKMSEGKMSQTAERLTQSREQIKLELGKVAKDGLVSLDDIKRIEAQLRTRIAVDIEVTDANLLATLVAFVAPDGVLLDSLELSDISKLPPTDAALLNAWMAPTVSSDSNATTSSSWSKFEEKLKEVSRRRNFWGTRGGGTERERFDAGGNSQSQSSATMKSYVDVGQVKAFRVNEQVLTSTFDKVINVAVTRPDLSFYALPPISTEFTVKMFDCQLRAAANKAGKELVDSLDEVRASWVSVEQVGKEKPYTKQQTFSASYQVKDESSRAQEPVLIVEREFEADGGWSFDPVDPSKESVQVTSHMPGQEATLVSISPAVDAQGKPKTNKLKWVVQLKKPAGVTDGGFTISLPNRALSKPRELCVSEVTQRVCPVAKDGKPLTWTVERRGGYLEVPLDLKRERIDGLPEKLMVDVRLLIATQGGSEFNELFLSGEVFKDKTSNISGLTVEYVSPKKPEEKPALRLMLNRTQAMSN